jgi:hypothetical protein
LSPGLRTRTDTFVFTLEGFDAPPASFGVSAAGSGVISASGAGDTAPDVVLSCVTGPSFPGLSTRTETLRFSASVGVELAAVDAS